ncbi:stage III sporulation protein AF [Pueribacillus sp. YX66]|uniref:stage III sporulation protein AF n=1 Tax=Pueribacillus sp. YX66 TaxID=3229242 RepID=UPI00358D1FBD
MQLLNEWIGNIVIFILVAVIMELLVPNTQLQKYVKMVVGLLLILLLLSPLLNVFSTDPDKIFDSIKIEETISEDFFEKNMNKQKKEIQATQSAYIEEQMAVQMKRQVEEELMERYELSIEQLTIQLNTDLQQNYENIKMVHAVMKKLDDNNVKKVARVEKVYIGSKPSVKTNENRIEQEIKDFLANEWDIEQEKLIIDIDGRERS